MVVASDPALAGECGNLALKFRDCFVVSLLAMTLYLTFAWIAGSLRLQKRNK